MSLTAIPFSGMALYRSGLKSAGQVRHRMLLPGLLVGGLQNVAPSLATQYCCMYGSLH